MLLIHSLTKPSLVVSFLTFVLSFSLAANAQMKNTDMVYLETQTLSSEKEDLNKINQMNDNSDLIYDNQRSQTYAMLSPKNEALKPEFATYEKQTYGIASPNLPNQVNKQSLSSQDKDMLTLTDALMPQPYEIELMDTSPEAFNHCMDEVSKGDTKAMYTLAKFYLTGKGAPRDIEAALDILECAAYDVPEAAYLLGDILIRGRFSIDANLSAGIKWILESAKQDFVPAQHLMALCFLRGVGVNYNFNKAYIWAKRAADHGYKSSQILIGYMTKQGIGTRLDEKKGSALISLACNDKSLSSNACTFAR